MKPEGMVRDDGSVPGSAYGAVANGVSSVPARHGLVTGSDRSSGTQDYLSAVGIQCMVERLFLGLGVYQAAEVYIAIRLPVGRQESN